MGVGVGVDVARVEYGMRVQVQVQVRVRMSVQARTCGCLIRQTEVNGCVWVGAVRAQRIQSIPEVVFRIRRSRTCPTSISYMRIPKVHQSTPLPCPLFSNTYGRQGLYGLVGQWMGGWMNTGVCPAWVGTSARQRSS